MVCECSAPVARTRRRVRSVRLALDMFVRVADFACNRRRRGPEQRHERLCRYTCPKPTQNRPVIFSKIRSPQFYIPQNGTRDSISTSPCQFRPSCKMVLPPFPPLIATLPKYHMISFQISIRTLAQRGHLSPCTDIETCGKSSCDLSEG